MHTFYCFVFFPESSSQTKHKHQLGERFKMKKIESAIIRTHTHTHTAVKHGKLSRLWKDQTNLFTAPRNLSALWGSPARLSVVWSPSVIPLQTWPSAGPPPTAPTLPTWNKAVCHRLLPGSCFHMEIKGSGIGLCVGNFDAQGITLRGGIRRCAYSPFPAENCRIQMKLATVRYLQHVHIDAFCRYVDESALSYSNE